MVDHLKHCINADCNNIEEVLEKAIAILQLTPSKQVRVGIKARGTSERVVH